MTSSRRAWRPRIRRTSLRAWSAGDGGGPVSSSRSRAAIWTHSRTRRTLSRSISQSQGPASAAREICAAGSGSG
uniref:Uncharacterized protein n=1 Tax=Arundo donax TaxID=35708 RepID=A0A0A9D8C3_ARUDO